MCRILRVSRSERKSRRPVPALASLNRQSSQCARALFLRSTERADRATSHRRYPHRSLPWHNPRAGDPVVRSAPGFAMVHAAPAAIKRNARLPTTTATSGDTRGSPNIGTPTQAIHASAGDQATRNRIADRARPISRPSRLTTACRRARVTRPPGTASTDIRPHTIESNTGMDANPLATKPRSASPPAGKFAPSLRSRLPTLESAARRWRRHERARRERPPDSARRSPPPFVSSEKRFYLRRLGVPELVARELRPKVRSAHTAPPRALLSSLELRHRHLSQ
jgi:hypothetical protein